MSGQNRMELHSSCTSILFRLYGGNIHVQYYPKVHVSMIIDLAAAVNKHKNIKLGYCYCYCQLLVLSVGVLPGNAMAHYMYVVCL